MFWTNFFFFQFTQSKSTTKCKTLIIEIKIQIGLEFHRSLFFEPPVMLLVSLKLRIELRFQNELKERQIEHSILPNLEFVQKEGVDIIRWHHPHTHIWRVKMCVNVWPNSSFGFYFLCVGMCISIMKCMGNKKNAMLGYTIENTWSWYKHLKKEQKNMQKVFPSYIEAWIDASLEFERKYIKKIIRDDKLFVH